MANGQGWSRWQKDEPEPPATLATRMSFWRTKEMVLGGGFPESLEAHGLTRSAQPLPSCCRYEFLARWDRDFIQKSAGKSQRDVVLEGRGCPQVRYGPHLAPTCFSSCSFRRAGAWRNSHVGKEGRRRHRRLLFQLQCVMRFLEKDQPSPTRLRSHSPFHLENSFLKLLLSLSRALRAAVNRI